MFAVLITAAVGAVAPSPIAQAALQPWTSFVGHCWAGPAAGQGGVDTHCFESVYGGQHVRDRHHVTVGGKTVYLGETLYSVEGQEVTFTYWNSIGGVGRGKAIAKGDTLDFSGDVRATPETASERFTARWRKVEGGYEVSDPGRKNSLFRLVD